MEKKLVPDYGDLMPMLEFIECCKSGCFIDDDGIGEYSDGVFCFDDVYPSDITNGNTKNYSHVVWYNR